MATPATGSYDTSEALMHIFHQLTITNGIVTRLYKTEAKDDGMLNHEYELEIQEGYLIDWSRKLAAAIDSDAGNVGIADFIDSIEEFRAERRYQIWNNRGESPAGALILDKLGNLRTSEQLLRDFNSQSLTEAAETLGIALTEAADLKVLLAHRSKL